MLMSKTPASMTTILLIDDDTDLATVFCDALILNGFAALRAMTGQEGLQLAQRYRPQLIVCDIGLSDINGYDVLSSLRSHPSTMAIPVIVLTGHGDAETFRRAMEHGADDYLTKPVDFSCFLRAVKTQLFKREQLAQYFTAQSIEPTDLQLASPATPEELDDQLARLKQAVWSHVCLLRLCNYGEFYTGYGHVLGQLAIQSIGQQLHQWRERWHTSVFTIALAYLGGDRFGLFLSASDASAEVSCQPAMAELQTELQQPMVIHNHHLMPDIQIETVRCSAITGGELLGAGMTAAAPVISQPSPAEQLQRAIQKDELQLYFQPQIDLSSGQIIGAEALVRWRVPGTSRMLSPMHFIPIAEENELMVPLGEWIFEAALQQLAHWQTKQLMGISVAVNLSAHQLNTPRVIDRLFSLVDAAGVSPIMVDLELPESLLMEDLSRSKLLLTQLQRRGFSIAIDDFGSSSLSYLQHLPVNILKLDKCFVRDLHQNQSNQIIVRAIMEMARGLNISTIANGVETPRELSILKQLKCESMQGYLFSPPLPAQDFEKLLRNASKKQPNPAMSLS